ncbi:unnamed protein product [Heterobilharzia americana]|nr:unnamed protein product [Heterobilharzia americana]
MCTDVLFIHLLSGVSSQMYITLPQSYSWLPSSAGNVPEKALQAGETSSSEPLFVARGMVNGEMCIGKVHPSHGCAYFPWGGDEHAVQHYEVLCFSD